MISRVCLSVALAAAAILPPFAPAQEPRTSRRLLYGFEQPGELTRLMKNATNADLAVVSDNGVTEGKNCLRWAGRKGEPYSVIYLDTDAIRGWGDFDYFAVDVFTEDEHPYTLMLELWDAASKNYATRCSYESVQTRPGRQTLLYPIGKARRNGKGGLDWGQLAPADRIDLNGLKQVKLVINPRPDRDAVLWIDNIRLLQEDAAKPKLRVPLPPRAVAFKFGSPGVESPGFKTVSPGSRSGPGRPGFVDTQGLAAGGDGWPDALAGTFVLPPEGKPLEFRAPVPDGDYRVWLCAGPIYRLHAKDRRYTLRINGSVIADESPSAEEYYGDKHLYRFLHTQYSERPHALWERYVERMYPVHERRLQVTDGTLRIEAANYFLSAVVLVPNARKGEFERFAAETRALRRDAFEKTLRPVKRGEPQPAREDGAYVLYSPDPFESVHPTTRPTAADRERTSLRAAAAPGQRVTMRLAVVPFADLGPCTLHITDLKGPATIPAEQVRVHFQNDRFDGDSLSEMTLVPSPTLEAERGVTRCLWLWLHVPEQTPAGTYRAEWTFQPGKGRPLHVPVEVEVYPFRLEPVLPVSYGMYYDPRLPEGLPEATRSRLLREQLQLMRQIGFTAVPVGAPVVTGLDKKGGVRLQFDSEVLEAAKSVGMGRHPRQYQMGRVVNLGRGVGRQLMNLDGTAIDRDPGVELRQPGFRDLFLDALRQYRGWIDRGGLPVAVEVVDEPREVPNPWNRNLADTIAYAKLVRAAGLTGFITPMSDQQDGKDYTVLADEADIQSVHAWKGSARLIERTRRNGKTLWFYNTGMDRFSWGFYPWKAGAEGRWEWHFCWPEDQARGGYPGREWYNPFTGSHGLACDAPISYPGGVLLSSAFMDVAEGITDRAYLYTLERAVERNVQAGKHADAVRDARAFLEGLKRSIPDYPPTKGLEHDADGALVGKGLEDEARLQAPRWRERISELLRVLMKPE